MAKWKELKLRMFRCRRLNYIKIKRRNLTEAMQKDLMPSHMVHRIALQTLCFKLEKLLQAKSRSIELRAKLLTSLVDKQDEHLRSSQQQLHYVEDHYDVIYYWQRRHK